MHEAVEPEVDDPGVAPGPVVTGRGAAGWRLRHDEYIQSRVARNPATPVYALEALCGSRHAEVRAAVLENPSLPAEALEPWLAAETSDLVIFRAADRRDLPRSVLDTWATPNPNLKTDKGLVVAARGASLSRARALLQHDNPQVLQALASREDADDKMLWTLSRSRHASVAEKAKAHRGFAAARSRALRWRVTMGVGLLLALLGCAGAAFAVWR